MQLIGHQGLPSSLGLLCCVLAVFLMAERRVIEALARAACPAPSKPPVCGATGAFNDSRLRFVDYHLRSLVRIDPVTMHGCLVPLRGR